MKTTPKNLLIVFTAIIICILVYVFVYWPVSPLGSQLHNLKLADEQAKLLSEKFKDDVKFQHVNFSRYTGLGGCLMVSGTVTAKEDFYSVTNSIGATACPVGICYRLMTSNQSAQFDWFDHGNEAPSLIQTGTQ